MRFIDFFDRAYVINLPSRIDRRQEIEKELEGAEIPLKLGKVELFPAIKPDKADPFVSVGTKGCFLSHLNILKKAKADGLKNVLILEDDLRFQKKFKQYGDLLAQELSKRDWHIVHFGFFFPDRSLPYSKDEIPTLKPCPDEIQGTHFYAVNGNVIDQLIDFLEVLMHRPVGHPDGGVMSIDGALNVFKWQHPEIVRLVLDPPFGDQRSSRSDISPSRLDQIPVLNSFVELARNAGFSRSLKDLSKTISSSFKPVS